MSLFPPVDLKIRINQLLTYLHVHLLFSSQGSTYAAAFLSSPKLLSAVEAVTAAMPDLLSVQLAALNDSSVIPTLVGGLMAAFNSKSLCVTVPFSALFPEQLRTRPAILNLDKEMCGLLAALSNVTSDLQADYKPITDVSLATRVVMMGGVARS